MQTYNSIRGMTVCVSGGEYVNRKDAENKIAALRDKLSEMIIVNGQALACSPYVKSAYDKQDAEPSTCVMPREVIDWLVKEMREGEKPASRFNSGRI